MHVDDGVLYNQWYRPLILGLITYTPMVLVLKVYSEFAHNLLCNFANRQTSKQMKKVDEKT